MRKRVIKSLRLPSRDLSWMLEYESTLMASERLGMDEDKVKELMDKGELVYAYSPKYKKKVLVGDGYVERKRGEKGRAGEDRWEGGVISGTIKYLVWGPKSALGIVVWMLLFPVTVTASL